MVLDTVLQVQHHHIHIHSRGHLINRNHGTITNTFNWLRHNHALASEHTGREIMGAGGCHSTGLHCAAVGGHTTGLHTRGIGFRHVMKAHHIGNACSSCTWGGTDQANEDADGG